MKTVFLHVFCNGVCFLFLLMVLSFFASGFVLFCFVLFCFVLFCLVLFCFDLHKVCFCFLFVQGFFFSKALFCLSASFLCLQFFSAKCFVCKVIRYFLQVFFLQGDPHFCDWCFFCQFFFSGVIFFFATGGCFFQLFLRWFV